jgi:heme-degrading monooxygenase HmoA
VIARIWRGWTTQAGADEYERHFRSSVLGELEPLEGFLGASLLQEQREGEVELLVITWFESMEAVQRFAGPDPAHAVVQEEARRVLTRYHDSVTHYQVRLSTGTTAPGQGS